MDTTEPTSAPANTPHNGVKGAPASMSNQQKHVQSLLALHKDEKPSSVESTGRVQDTREVIEELRQAIIEDPWHSYEKGKPLSDAFRREVFARSIAIQTGRHIDVTPDKLVPNIYDDTFFVEIPWEHTAGDVLRFGGKEPRVAVNTERKVVRVPMGAFKTPITRMNMGIKAAAVEVLYSAFIENARLLASNIDLEVLKLTGGKAPDEAVFVNMSWDLTSYELWKSQGEDLINFIGRIHMGYIAR